MVGIPFVTFGAFLGGRRPQNPIGWLFAGWGTVMAAMAFAMSYVQRGLVLQPGSLPGPDWVAWALAVIWHPAFALLVFVLLLFPHGHLPSPRWRPVAWLTVAAYGAMAVAVALSPPSVTQGYFPEARGVFAVPGAEIAETVFDWALLPAQVGLLGVAGITALVVKLRRARGDERQQLKWFVFTVAVAIVTFVAGIFVLGDGRLFPVFGAIPAAAVLAILRYRLYDIDRVINRTLVYTVLTALLGMGYAIVILVSSQLVGPDSSVSVAAATLGMAALFRPARRRIQDSVDRRFNRQRYDAAETVRAFGARLRDHVDLETVSAELLAVVNQTVEPSKASLWLRREHSHGGR
ncbi:MAG: hypothetical protein ACRDZO_03150 [Egibacteraceae bacterium]